MKYKLLLFASLFIVLSACGEPPTPKPTTAPQESAWYACTTFVQQQLGVSLLDAQDYTSGGVTVLGNDQYSVEVFYADQGSSYRCELSRHVNGDWELLGLEAK